MSDSSEPASPINGRIPADREYRIVDEATVEQWSEWAGFWDIAFEAASAADAKRYIREHTANETSTYRVAGLRRQQGAIGVSEPFLVDQVAPNVEAARDAAVQSSYDTGFEHVQIRAVVRVTDAKKRTEELASAYWNERWQPAGTYTGADGKTHHSSLAQEIWDQMGEVIGPSADENEAALSRCGVPAKFAKLLAPTSDLTLEATCLRWTGHSPVDGYQLDQLLSPPLENIEAWSDSFRWVWTDDVRLMVTYCEGDLSGQLYFTSEAFEAAYADAGRFYEDH